MSGVFVWLSQQVESGHTGNIGIQVVSAANTRSVPPSRVSTRITSTTSNRMVKLGCGATCLKYIMFFINFIFWITGAVMLGVGIWLAVDTNALSFLDGVVSEEPMKDPLFAACVYTVIGVGAFVFLLGFLGCFGACTTSSCILLVYIIIVSIVLVAELVVVILMFVFWKDIDDGMNGQMLKSLREQYGRPTVLQNTTNPTTVSWNAMQKDFKCCGVNSHKDYDNSYWRNTSAYAHFVPTSCCKGENIADVALCQKEANSDLDNITDREFVKLHSSGCHAELKDWFDDNAVIFIAVACSFLALQILGLVFSCILRCAINDEEEGEEKGEEAGQMMNDYQQH